MGIVSTRMKNKSFNPATSKFYYLNNDGSRGVRIDANGNRETLPVSFDGVNVKQVAVKYWEQFGNFSVPYVRKGKKIIAVYPDNETEVKKWMPFNVKYPQK